MAAEQAHQNSLKSKITIIVLVLTAGAIIAGILFKREGKNSPKVISRTNCAVNMKGLGTAFLRHAFQNDNTLMNDNWCDVLVSMDAGNVGNLVCSRSGAVPGKECSYALNIAAAGKDFSKLPSDLVLLFESRNGWNLIGGKELLNFDNHDGQGFSVLFLDGSSRFVDKKDVDELRWTFEVWEQ